MSAPAYVLLVDDDPDLRQSFIDVLEDAGFVARAASSGREALALLSSPPLPGLILLDLMMPDLNGWQFFEQQHLDARLAGIPVLVVTASRGVAGNIPGADVLLKPFSADNLVNKVRDLMAHV